MRTDELDSDPPPHTGFHGPRFWWVTSALSVFSSTSFVITQLMPAPDSQWAVRIFVLGMFIVGFLTGIFSAAILMMSGVFAAGTATLRGREIPSSELEYFFLGCYLVPVIVVAWSLLRNQGVL